MMNQHNTRGEDSKVTYSNPHGNPGPGPSDKSSYSELTSDLHDTTDEETIIATQPDGDYHNDDDHHYRPVDNIVTTGAKYGLKSSKYHRVKIHQNARELSHLVSKGLVIIHALTRVIRAFEDYKSKFGGLHTGPNYR